MNIENGIRSMINNGEKSLKIYWLEDIQTGDDEWWIDVCEDHLAEICEINWIWNVISDSEIDKHEYGWLESDIIVDKPFSKDIIKQAIKEWLNARELNIEIEIVSSEGSIAKQHLLDIIKDANLL